MSTRKTKVTFSGLTNLQARILTEASNLANSKGVVCRDSLMERLGIKSVNLSCNISTMKRNSNFPFTFACKTGRPRQNVSVTVKVPAQCLAEYMADTE